MPSVLQVGQILNNRYCVHSYLAQTMYSTTYIAYDTHIQGRYWILKEINLSYFNDRDCATAIQYLKGEGARLNTLDHVCMPKIAEYFPMARNFCILREYMPGKDLAYRLSTERVLPEPEILSIGIQLCDFIDYLQAKNFLQTVSINNRIKLSNLVVRDDGKLSMLNVGFPTVDRLFNDYIEDHGYAPPEFFTGTPTTESKMTVYMVGALLYHLFSGLNPATSTFRLPPLENVRQGLSTPTKATIEKAIRPDPRDRYASLADLRNGLIKSYQTAARKAGIKNRPTYIDRDLSGPPSWLWLMAVIMFFMLGGSLFAAYQIFLK